jgi:hypothetical protein
MRNLAKHLMALETLGSRPPELKIPAVFHVSCRLRLHLVTLFGNAGYQSLLSRAVVLVYSEVPWLRKVHMKPDGSLEWIDGIHPDLDPSEFLRGKIVLLAQLLGTLVAYVGPRLTLRMASELWPQISPNKMDFVKESQNESQGRPMMPSSS